MSEHSTWSVPLRRWFGLLVVVTLGSLLIGACAAENDVAVDDEGTAADDEDEGTAADDEDEVRDVEHRMQLAACSGADQHLAHMLRFWADRVNELSGGGIEIAIGHLGEFVGQGEEFPAASDGRVELMQACSPLHGAELPLSQVTSLPFITFDGEAMSRALMQLYDEFEPFREEHRRNNIHLLTVLGLDVAVVVSTEPLDDLDDFQGLTIRSVGYHAQAAEIAGADNTTLLTGEVYEALQRGAVESATFNLEAYHKFGWYEVAPNIQDVGVGGYQHLPVAINLDVWEGLSAEYQAAFTQASDDLIEVMHEFAREEDQKACEVVLDAGNRVTVWDDEAKSAWGEVVGDTLERQWIDASGPDAEEFLEKYRELLDEHERASNWVNGIQACAQEYERRENN